MIEQGCSKVSLLKFAGSKFKEPSIAQQSHSTLVAVKATATAQSYPTRADALRREQRTYHQESHPTIIDNPGGQVAEFQTVEHS